MSAPLHVLSPSSRSQQKKSKPRVSKLPGALARARHQALRCLALPAAKPSTGLRPANISFPQGPTLHLQRSSLEESQLSTQQSAFGLSLPRFGRKSPDISFLELHFQQRTAIEARPSTITTLLCSPSARTLFASRSRRSGWRNWHRGDDMSPLVTLLVLPTDRERLEEVRDAGAGSGTEGFIVQFMVMRLSLARLGHTRCVGW
jgi:hypothetical protein